MFRRKPTFTSAEELFAAVRTLVEQMKAGGQVRGADELEAGMRCLNGLTDGWGLFLDSIDRVAGTMFDDLTPEQKGTCAGPEPYPTRPH